MRYHDRVSPSPQGVNSTEIRVPVWSATHAVNRSSAARSARSSAGGSCRFANGQYAQS